MSGSLLLLQTISGSPVRVQKRDQQNLEKHLHQAVAFSQRQMTAPSLVLARREALRGLPQPLRNGDLCANWTSASSWVSETFLHLRRLGLMNYVLATGDESLEQRRGESNEKGLLCPIYIQSSTTAHEVSISFISPYHLIGKVIWNITCFFFL